MIFFCFCYSLRCGGQLALERVGRKTGKRAGQQLDRRTKMWPSEVAAAAAADEACGRADGMGEFVPLGRAGRVLVTIVTELRPSLAGGSFCCVAFLALSLFFFFRSFSSVRFVLFVFFSLLLRIWYGMFLGTTPKIPGKKSRLPNGGGLCHPPLLSLSLDLARLLLLGFFHSFSPTKIDLSCEG